MGLNPKQLPRGEGDRLSSWRQRTLVAAGFDEDLARRVTAQRAVDLHALLVLVDRGCPPPVAARILAPLDWEDT